MPPIIWTCSSEIQLPVPIPIVLVKVLAVEKSRTMVDENRIPICPAAPHGAVASIRHLIAIRGAAFPWRIGCRNGKKAGSALDESGKVDRVEDEDKRPVGGVLG